MNEKINEAFEKAYESVLNTGWTNLKNMAQQIWDMASTTTSATPPAEPEPVEQTPARVVMDLTGGVVQWALADVPVDFVIVDDNDDDAVQVKAYPPQHMDIDRAVVDRFFEQTQEK